MLEEIALVVLDNHQRHQRHNPHCRNFGDTKQRTSVMVEKYLERVRMTRVAHYSRLRKVSRRGVHPGLKRTNKAYKH